METEYITSGGVTIYHDSGSHLHSFCLSLYVKAGSMYENKENNGISHFFEHIVFRNIHYGMGESLYQTLDRLGLVFNAATYKEFMVFFITGAPEHFREAAQILTKVMEPLVLPEKEIDTERKRIKAEIREQDEKSSLASFAQKTIWKNTSLALPIAGRKKGLSAITKKELSDFQQEIFSPGNFFLYVTGQFPAEDLEYLDTLLSSRTLPEKCLCRNNIAPKPEAFFHRKKKVYYKKGETTTVCFGIDLDAQKYSPPERQLLYDILFEGDFCKIHQALSEKKGYIYSYDAWLEEYKNLANIRFMYEVQPKNLSASVREVFDVFSNLKKGIGDSLTYAMPSYVDNAHLLEDDAEDYNWTMAYENHILDFKCRGVEQRAQAYAAVSADRMTQICREVFCSENIVLLVEGPEKKLDIEELEKIRSSF